MLRPFCRASTPFLVPETYMAGTKPGHDAFRDSEGNVYFTSFRPVIFSRLPYMIALRFAFDMSMPSRIFSVSRM